MKLLDIFLNQLHADELSEGYFYEYVAAADTPNSTIRYLEQFFDDCLISRWLWSDCFSDNTNNIVEKIDNIKLTTLVKVFADMKRRLEICSDHN